MYNCYTPKFEREDEEEPRTVKTPTRPDGRAWNQFRPMFFDVGMITQASGSAYMEVDHTKVVCAVYGPKPRQDVAFSDKGTILCDLRYAPFARRIRRERGQQQEEEKALSLLVVQALESSIQLDKLPKSVIEIYILILQSDGGDLGAAITCTSLALADSGIELFGLVSACCVGSRDGKPLLDPSKEEADEGGDSMTLAVMASTGEVTQWIMEGRREVGGLGSALELATDGCAIVHNMMRRRLLKTVQDVAGQPRQAPAVAMEVS